jgi:hypothetical protein
MGTDSDQAIARDLIAQLKRIAAAIYPPGVQPSQDETGSYVASLTEAVMGNTRMLGRIEEQLREMAAYLGNIDASLERDDQT